MFFWLLFPPFFVLLMLTIFAVLARAGGWTALARQYRCDGVPEGEKFSFQFAEFGWVGYNGCVTIRISTEGLYLAIWPVFRFSHPPLLIPWSDLHVLRVRPTAWIPDVTLSAGRPPVARIRLPFRVLEAARRLGAAESEGMTADADAPQ